MEIAKKLRGFKCFLPAVFLLFVIFGVRAGRAEAAATLSISPYSGSYQVGQTLSVKISATSQDAAVNAASGVISFPQDKLEITSLSKTGSIITLWAQDPSFSNNTGTINFEGVVLNPGFQGSNGKILTVNFRVKAAGEASIAFASGSLLANDGLGTNIISGFVNADFGLKPLAQNQEAGESTTPSETNPLAPQISSPTHPNPDSWYNNSNPKFAWNVPAGVTSVRIQYDKYPQSVPSVAYTPPISEKSLQSILDGTWYFHVQFKDANGWGSVSHLRFQIDTAPPEKFNIKFIDTANSENPRPTVLFNTTDSLSGIDYYKVKIGNSDFMMVSSKAVESNPYTLPPEDPGNYTMLVQAFDKAGNYETSVSEFKITTLPAPIISNYPSIIQPNEIFAVKGTTQPLSKVSVFLEKNDIRKEFTGSSDESGSFVVAGDGSFDPGTYTMWVEATTPQGAHTSPSDKHNVVVESPYILRIGSYAISILNVVISVVALLALLALIFWYGWKKVLGLRIRVRKESQDASRATHKEFAELKDKLRGYMKNLEKAKTKRGLTLEEQKMLSELRGDIDKTEEAIEKDIDEIKRDLS